MGFRKRNRPARETIKFPVRYDSNRQIIWDAKGLMVCDIKRWGEIEQSSNLQEQKAIIGRKMAGLLNESIKDLNSADDEQLVEQMIFI